MSLPILKFDAVVVGGGGAGRVGQPDRCGAGGDCDDRRGRGVP